MGRFAFPVPGRRQKPILPPPPSGPLNKAQKVLGTGDISIDSPILPRDPSRGWDTASSISVAVTDADLSIASEMGMKLLADHEDAHGDDIREEQWGEVEEEVESAIIPKDLTSPAQHVAGSRGNEWTTDTSSLRRQLSSSTIVSHYDKATLPLSISQQTSASLMAKGLPPKANLILDIDGTKSASATKPKKKPAKLDLSYFLPKVKSPKHLSPRPQHPLVLGPDMMTRSPSVLSMTSPDAISPVSGRVEKSFQAQVTDLETAKTNTSLANLHSLYEHYEQRTFQDVMGAELGMITAETRRPAALLSPPPTSTARGFLSPYSNATPRGPFSTSVSPASTPNKSEGYFANTLGVISTSADCSASISSRHTKTSKASKRTDQSLADIDLLQNSVLSLSSDSEDDSEELPKTSLSIPRRSSAESATSVEPRQRIVPPALLLPPAQSQGQFPLRSSSMGDKNNISPLRREPQRPVIAARRSSLSLKTPVTAKSVASSSRLSFISMASTISQPMPQLSPPRKGAYGTSEAKAITMFPATRSNTDSARHRPQLSLASNASDQPTPPLSPTSMDFYLQSQHNSMMLDNMSIRSGFSLGSAVSARSAPQSIRNGSLGGRFMAVTRQEEQLLAALRQKRASMRESTSAEFVVDPDRMSTETAVQYPEHTVSMPPKQRSLQDLQRPSGRQVSRHSSYSSVKLAPLHEFPQAKSSTRDVSPHRDQHKTLIPSSPPKLPVISTEFDESEGSQLLMYVNHHGATASSTAVQNAGEVEPSEPSPDLSDFMVFDDGNSDEILFQSPGSGAGDDRSDSSSRHGRSRGGDVYVRIVGDSPEPLPTTPLDEDIPRPDSPISPPSASLPLPSTGEGLGTIRRKKRAHLSAVGLRTGGKNPAVAGRWVPAA